MSIDIAWRNVKMLKAILREDEESKWEPRCILEHNGEIIDEYWDGGEPEDNSFYRDWGWVPGAIEKAYKLGLEDGKKS